MSFDINVLLCAKARERESADRIKALLSESLAYEPDKNVSFRYQKTIDGNPMAGVRVVEAPREIKSFPYFMAWHPRLTREPAHKCFREQLRSVVRIV